jgi:hypothetical protein
MRGNFGHAQTIPLCTTAETSLRNENVATESCAVASFSMSLQTGLLKAAHDQLGPNDIALSELLAACQS